MWYRDQIYCSLVPMFRIVLLFFFLVFTGACGVKGKPLPPETPREIGIGKPQYEGVDKELQEDKKKKEKQ